ncbi:N-acetylglucosamine-6-phosphate deacetylase [Amaricoccus sp.]|uniref:N-acetylglucosamine-6-phosphate deacetylase n=1 Tax=Amaricoccus sp. TaxID=1872485 RepID=UPI001B5214A2|nr:N-acetylglucosamine-6-phosphate deacetylase [Amaricoccus sp.]MBP7241144.1 N-acetylglucosamine-6-phosphate deacetylase [Amaricoccus sp.]
MTETLILADRLYDGVRPELQPDRAVVIRDGTVVALRPATDADRATPGAIRAAIAAPGMIDIQINGAADTQFNFEPTAAAIARIARGARQGGTAHILPTFITAHGQAYLTALAAARQAIEAGAPGVIGVHLEGPFLSPARPGIHDRTAIRPLAEADVAALEREAASFPGVILLTLAPECQEPERLRRLSDAGIILFAGHSEAKAEHLERISGATHLWNAMPGPASRATGIVSEVLGGDRLFAGLIADGHHVRPHALRMSVRAAADRLCLVTDAMLTLAGTIQSFDLDGKLIKLADGRLTGQDGTLAGAHIAMDESLRNLVDLAGMDLVGALRMGSTNPARALRLDHELGRIAPGTRASISLFDEALSTLAVISG